jgi:hypothetical protein
MYIVKKIICMKLFIINKNEIKTSDSLYLLILIPLLYI